MTQDSDARSPGRRRLRFVTYNVHACIGTDGVFSPARIRGVLEELQADFIGIQELEDRDFQGNPVSDYLARSLGMHAYRGPTLRRGDAHYGNLLLSGQRAIATRMHDISVPGREPRGVIECDYDVTGGRIRVLVSHFGLRSRERRRQVDELAAIASDNRADVDVLMGDFNEWRPASHTMRVLKRHFGTVLRRRSWPSRRPLLSLDGICVSPAAVELSHGVARTTAARQASDHLPVVCDVFLPRPATTAGNSARESMR
jgi:endonuclease/exonuclease/phosphatase family metal-dependent hydrolase